MAVKVPKEEPRDAVLPVVPIAPALKHAAVDTAADAKERGAALKSITDQRRASAWQLHRWPLDKRIIDVRTRVHLPRTYLAVHGEDVRVAHAGTDLNQFVYQHYLERVEQEHGNWANYVSPKNIVARRYEFLGPDPRVAGYFFDVDGDAHIKWWDAFLRDQWMEKHKWRFEVQLDADGGWVEKD
ncbi:hypothetical protein B0H21DRAFT_697364 [Amylocystis lapponica]|nr:hypothetical protein B0H21DRAFT_697364 [Amylocystis lapponica]